MLAEMRIKPSRFFEAFLEGIVRTAEATRCKCARCHNLEELRLKIIVHSGRAVYHTIARLPQIAGTDVILAHRPRRPNISTLQSTRHFEIGLTIPRG